jgi:Flp pilus assembly protein TadD
MTFPQEKGREVPQAPPTGQTVSVGQLRHRVSRELERGFQHATKLGRAGEHGKAAAALETVVDRDPEFLRAEIQLGIEYAFLQRWDDAETVLRRSLQMEPTSASAHYILALILYCKGDLPGAEQSTRRALLFASQNPLAHMFLGELLLKREETHAEGIAELKFAARTNPDARRLLRDMGTR